MSITILFIIIYKPLFIPINKNEGMDVYLQNSLTPRPTCLCIPTKPATTAELLHSLLSIICIYLFSTIEWQTQSTHVRSLNNVYFSTAHYPFALLASTALCTLGKLHIQRSNSLIKIHKQKMLLLANSNFRGIAVAHLFVVFSYCFILGVWLLCPSAF